MFLCNSASINLSFASLGASKVNVLFCSLRISHLVVFPLNDLSSLFYDLEDNDSIKGVVGWCDGAG